MIWIRDEEFVRGNIPMTKFDVRLASIAALEVEKGNILLDIGAGTGSVSVQAARLGACVFAVEEKDEGVNLIKENALKFNTDIRIIKGKAPEALYDIPTFDRCFIGGSGGNLKEIFKYVNSNLSHEGIIVANFITLNNLNTFSNLLKDNNYIDIEVKLLQISYVDRIGLLKANNPIFIVRGKKS